MPLLWKVEKKHLLCITAEQLESRPPPMLHNPCVCMKSQSVFPWPKTFWRHSAKQWSMNEQMNKFKSHSRVVSPFLHWMIFVLLQQHAYSCTRLPPSPWMTTNWSLFAPSHPDHSGETETYHVSVGHLLVLKCRIADAHTNVTWSREGRHNQSLPAGVEVREGLLWFLPVQMSHNGSYTCEKRYRNLCRTWLHRKAKSCFVKYREMFLISFPHAIQFSSTTNMILKNYHKVESTSFLLLFGGCSLSYCWICWTYRGLTT